ncbi:MAG TPA: hypothetical protein DCY20_01525 [Firmicutes bacterium]|nr:hypothetical protein [Bacillota bacterium]
MLMLYFSGTGNSKWLATRFSEKVPGHCVSIQEDVANKIANWGADPIGFCYPIYGGYAPHLMR